MLVTGGRVFVDGAFVEADIELEHELISRVVEGGLPQKGRAAYDVSGCYVVPGFIDLHFHGCEGFDLCDGTPEALEAIARWEAAHGITAICPATMTYPEEVLGTIMDVVGAFTSDEKPFATLVGVNLEGPFISPARVGAQNPAYVQRCDANMVRRLDERSGGLVKLVDVAPEEPGALDFIREMASDVRISLAHTCADYDCAAAAFEAGARQLTHMFNAMPALHHRNPGPIAAAAERDDVFVELIADGVHVHPAMVRLAFKLFGPERVVLISDSMRATGMGDGVFDLGGQDVHVKGTRATLADGTLAGSVTDLASCVRIAVNEMGVPLEHAITAATANPARALGIFDERGSIAAGKVADLVVLDEQLNVHDVILGGSLI